MMYYVCVETGLGVFYFWKMMKKPPNARPGESGVKVIDAPHDILAPVLSYPHNRPTQASDYRRDASIAASGLKAQVWQLEMIQNLSHSTQSPQKLALHNYIRYRMQHTDPKLYSHFADRKWLNSWPKIQRCGAQVPRRLAFFKPEELSNLRSFVAPAQGAVVKLNHMPGVPGALHFLRGNASISVKTIDTLASLVRQNYSSHQEKHYQHLEKGVFIEEFLPGFSKDESPMDLKFYAFDGHVAMAKIVKRKICIKEEQRGKNLCRDYISHVTPDFQKLPYYSKNKDPIKSLVRPCGWSDAVQAAKCLSRGINFVRVDLYILDCKPWLGEMTMTPFGGNHEVRGDNASEWLGGFLTSFSIYPRQVTDGIY